MKSAKKLAPALAKAEPDACCGNCQYGGAYAPPPGIRGGFDPARTRACAHFNIPVGTASYCCAWRRAS
ncbi:MAG TPA: hypothetical protein VGH15_05645 [Caulobacteraceae bacterium]|jgi:hypothetical protein